MNILVCGSCMPQKYEYLVKDLAAASNQYHLNMIKSLEKIGNVKVLSYIGMNLNGVSENNIKADCDLYGMDCVFKQKNIAKTFFEYRKKLKKYISWADVIITYNVQYIWFGVGNLSKRYGKKSVLIFADHTPISDRKTMISKIYGLLSEWSVRQYQKVVLLSPNMKKYVRDNQEYVISHGCIDWNQYKEFKNVEKKNETYFMFSGLLGPVTGVDLLLEALKKVKAQNIRVIITGKGPIDVKKYADEDDRIDFKGFVSRDEYLELLQKSDILINPRNMNLPENQNNFPSKILEYIAAGRRIISTKFPGYEEFTENCSFIDTSIDSLADKMEEFAVDKFDYDKQFILNRNKALDYVWDKEVEKFL